MTFYHTSAEKVISEHITGTANPRARTSIVGKERRGYIV